MVAKTYVCLLHLVSLLICKDRVPTDGVETGDAVSLADALLTIFICIGLFVVDREVCRMQQASCLHAVTGVESESVVEISARLVFVGAVDIFRSVSQGKTVKAME